MVYENILDAIGNTPTIKLNRMAEPESADILVKMEGLNVGGSIKTRTAFNMIEQAEKEGLLNKDSIIVETTSNQGIGTVPTGMLTGTNIKGLLHFGNAVALVFVVFAHITIICI